MEAPPASPTAPAPSVPSASPTPGPLDAFLPAHAGPFAGEAVTQGEGFVRRIYRRGAATMNVTLGVQGPGGKGAFAQWVSMSVAYPQIPLAAPADEANGFFDCKGDAAPTCDGHVHFKNGLHLELFGGGTASREEVSLLLGGLPVEGMAAR
jgi:hypothetical protein